MEFSELPIPFFALFLLLTKIFKVDDDTFLVLPFEIRVELYLFEKFLY